MHSPSLQCYYCAISAIYSSDFCARLIHNKMESKPVWTLSEATVLFQVTYLGFCRPLRSLTTTDPTSETKLLSDWEEGTDRKESILRKPQHITKHTDVNTNQWRSSIGDMKAEENLKKSCFEKIEMAHAALTQSDTCQHQCKGKKSCSFAFCMCEMSTCTKSYRLKDEGASS